MQEETIQNIEQIQVHNIEEFFKKYQFNDAITPIADDILGQTYRIKDIHQTEDFILKVFKIIKAENADNFLKELANIMSLQQHPNIYLPLQYYIDNTKDSFKEFYLIFLDSKTFQDDIQIRFSSTPKNFLSKEDISQLFDNLLDGMEWIQKNKLYIRDFQLSSLYITVDGKFQIGGLIEATLKIHNFSQYPSKEIEIYLDLLKVQNLIKSPKKQEISLEDKLLSILNSNTYKNDVYVLSNTIFEILTLGSNKNGYGDEDKKRDLIDNLKSQFNCDAIYLLHFMVAEIVSLRSDFINIKKMKDNPTNSKFKNLNLLKSSMLCNKLERNEDNSNATEKVNFIFD